VLRNRLAVALCAFLVPSLAGADEAYRIVVNPLNPAVAVARAELARLFMKQIPAWPNGMPVAVVDQPRTAPVRASFSRDIHKKDVEAVAAYWATRVYSGREVPPPVLRSDDDVLEFVRQTPGGLGYVSADASLRGVKVVALR
jgi:ABC-type phosphate transport system substrate-binding protein